MSIRPSVKLSEQLYGQLRQAIDQSGRSRYSIAQETGISEATLSKLYLGQRGLSSKALDKLGACLGLTITVKTTSKRKGSK